MLRPGRGPADAAIEDAAGRSSTPPGLGANRLFEIGAPSMTAMHDSMTGAPGLIARRQAGAGFGGCLVAIVDRWIGRRLRRAREPRVPQRHRHRAQHLRRGGLGGGVPPRGRLSRPIRAGVKSPGRKLPVDRSAEALPTDLTVRRLDDPGSVGEAHADEVRCGPRASTSLGCGRLRRHEAPSSLTLHTATSPAARRSKSVLEWQDPAPHPTSGERSSNTKQKTVAPGYRWVRLRRSCSPFAAQSVSSSRARCRQRPAERANPGGSLERLDSKSVPPSRDHPRSGRVRGRPSRRKTLDATRAIAAFSGGVDDVPGAATLGRDAGECVVPSRRRRARSRVRCQGQLHGLRGTARANETGDRLTRNLNVVGRSQDARAQHWENDHGSLLAAILHQFADSFEYGLIGSTGTFPPYTWGSRATDHLFSGGDFEIVHEGAGYTRTEKIESVASHPLARRTLKVCWEGPDRAGTVVLPRSASAHGWDSWLSAPPSGVLRHALRPGSIVAVDQRRRPRRPSCAIARRHGSTSNGSGCSASVSRS